MSTDLAAQLQAAADREHEAAWQARHWEATLAAGIASAHLIADIPGADRLTLNFESGEGFVPEQVLNAKGELLWHDPDYGLDDFPGARLAGGARPSTQEFSPAIWDALMRAVDLPDRLLELNHFELVDGSPGPGVYMIALNLPAAIGAARTRMDADPAQLGAPTPATRAPRIRNGRGHDTVYDPVRGLAGMYLDGCWERLTPGSPSAVAAKLLFWREELKAGRYSEWFTAGAVRDLLARMTDRSAQWATNDLGWSAIDRRIDYHAWLFRIAGDLGARANVRSSRDQLIRLIVDRTVLLPRTPAGRHLGGTPAANTPATLAATFEPTTPATQPVPPAARRNAAQVAPPHGRSL